MKITILEEHYTYTCDFAMLNKIEGKSVRSYHPSVAEAVDAALDLLGCVYPKESIAEYLAAGEAPALDYRKD